MYGIVKCLPVSRRKSIRPVSPSQSRLLTRSAPPAPGVKSRNRSSCERIAATFASSVSRSRRFRSADVPDGSPIIPVPPPSKRDRRPAVALELEQAEDRDEMADVERRAARIEAVVARDRPAARQARRQAGGGGVEHAPPFELGKQAAEALGGRHTPRSRAVGRPKSRGVTTTPMLSCGQICTPASRGASAIDVPAPAGGPAGPLPSRGP